MEVISQIDPYRTIALTEVILVQVSIHDIEQLPQLVQSLLRELMQRLKQTESLLAIGQERRVETLLRQLLAFLQKEMGQVTPQGIKISVRLTHQQLVGMIGTTRITVTRF